MKMFDFIDGMEDCAAGRKADTGRNSFYQRGYAIQYQHEQAWTEASLQQEQAWTEAALQHQRIIGMKPKGEVK